MIQIRSHHFLNDRDLVIADLHLSVSDHPKLCYTIRFVKQYEKLILYRILNPPAPNIKKDWMTFFPPILIRNLFLFLVWKIVQRKGWHHLVVLLYIGRRQEFSQKGKIFNRILCGNYYYNTCLDGVWGCWGCVNTK